MRLYEREWTIPRAGAGGDASVGLRARFAEAAGANLQPGEFPVRFVVSETGAHDYHCEVGILASGPGTGAVEAPASPIPSIFEFRKRAFEDAGSFNVVLLVPTGVNASLGG